MKIDIEELAREIYSCSAAQLDEAPQFHQIPDIAKQIYLEIAQAAADNLIEQLIGMELPNYIYYNGDKLSLTFGDKDTYQAILKSIKEQQ